MRDIEAVMQECIDEMKRIQIPIRDDEIIKVEAADIEDLGWWQDDGYWKNFIIQIRKDLLEEKCPMVVLKEVMIHELIHTCKRCWSHGKTFVKYAKMMDEAYGYHLMLIKDEDSIYHPEKPICQKFVCPKCGARYNSRKPKGNYACIYCELPLEEVL